MDCITPLERADIPGVAQLFQIVMRRSTTQTPLSLQTYIEQLYLESPWRDESISSLVFKRDGRVSGFISALSFPLTLQGTRIRAAIGGNFMIDPALANPLAGPRLLKMFLAGPQDVSYTDTANANARKMWEGLGSVSIQPYALQWLRVIRPSEFALIMSSQKKAIAGLAILAKPLSYLIDHTLAAIPKSPFYRERTHLNAKEMTTLELLEALRTFTARYALAPEYTESSLAWVIKHAEEKLEYGPLRKIALYTADHILQGWCLYYPNAGNVGRVLQLGATQRTARAVLSHLFSDAREQGSLALLGRMEPEYVQQLASQNCVFVHRGSSLMVHSKNTDIVNSLHRGDAFFTRLEGDWWTKLQGDTFKDGE